MSDLAVIGTYAVFIASYIAFALGKFPGMKMLAAQTPQKSERLTGFVDIAEKAGLTITNVFGGVDTKIEAALREELIALKQRLDSF